MKRILTSLLVFITILTVIPVSSVSASAAEKSVQIQYIDVNAGGKGVYLRWNKSSNVKYYCLFRKCLDGDNISLLKKVQTNDDSKDGYLRTYDNSYKPNYTYAYQVVSLDSKRNCLQKSDWKWIRTAEKPDVSITKESKSGKNIWDIRVLNYNCRMDSLTKRYFKVEYSVYSNKKWQPWKICGRGKAKKCLILNVNASAGMDNIIYKDTPAKSTVHIRYRVTEINADGKTISKSCTTYVILK